MKILIHSHVFWPSVGGIELTTERLAKMFVQAGHTVVVMTESTLRDDLSRSKSFPFTVVRCPSILKQWELALWADVIWQNNVSLRYFFPVCFLPVPKVITYQTWPGHIPGKRTWLSRLKRSCVGLSVTHVAISEAIAGDIRRGSRIIPNPFDSDLCGLSTRQVSPDRMKLLFVGRLVEDKGCLVLLKALALRTALDWSLDIVGNGDSRSELEAFAEENLPKDRVSFHGSLEGAMLSDAFCRSEVLIVPSIWEEPFGIVALEGLASGCQVIVSDGGGLPEAIGDCGPLFTSGDPADLNRKLDEVKLGEPLSSDRLKKHLDQFSLSRIGETYLSLFSSLV